MRIILRFILLALLAAAFAWFADRPGLLSIDWLGYRIEVSLGVAVLALFLLLVALWVVWSLTRGIWRAPGSVFGYFRGRRERRGHESLSKGLVAVAAGDAASARRHAQITARLLPEDPMARLLEAQTAQLEGDHGRVRGLLETMSEEPETRLVALRGLHAQARQQGDEARARKTAERAYAINSGLGWASAAVLSSRASDRDWPAVLSVLDEQSRTRGIDQAAYKRKRAAVHAAQALTAEDHDPQAALDLASKALKLDPGLIPAAAVAARVLISQNSLRKATKVIERAWAINPHPDLAELDAFARTGDSPQDRLKRVQDLLRASSGGEEGAVALARAAIDARDWGLARQSLEPYAAERPRARICTLMAEIEEGDAGDRGRNREWLARAVRAPRDPIWIADGFTSQAWLPVSPVTGEIGVFEWRPPPEALGYTPPAPLAPPEPAEPDLPRIEARPEHEPALVAVEAPIPLEPPKPEATPEPAKPSLAVVQPAPVVGPIPPAKTERVVVQLRQPDDPGPVQPSDADDDPTWPRRLAGA